MSHIARLDKQQLQEIASHMGHSLTVHRKFYRLQDDITELAKVSKVLLAIEGGFASSLQSKNLDQIDFDGE